MWYSKCKFAVICISTAGYIYVEWGVFYHKINLRKHRTGLRISYWINY